MNGSCDFCHGKRCHPSVKVAVSNLRAWLARLAERTGGRRPVLQVYHCGSCGWFHAGGVDVLLNRVARRACRRARVRRVELDEEGYAA